MSKRKHKQQNDDEGWDLEVSVTQEDIDEAARLGLDGMEVTKRAVERALRKKEQH